MLDADVKTTSGAQPKECLSERLVNAICHELHKEERINDQDIQQEVRTISMGN